MLRRNGAFVFRITTENKAEQIAAEIGDSVDAPDLGFTSPRLILQGKRAQDCPLDDDLVADTDVESLRPDLAPALTVIEIDRHLAVEVAGDAGHGRTNTGNVLYARRFCNGRVLFLVRLAE